MNYIIDGHNLISHIPGLDLSMPDDEQRLIALLIRFSMSGRHRVEVYFDKSPASLSGVRNHGRVRARYVSAHSSADDAIRLRLHHLGKASTTWVVITADRSVQAAARESHAGLMSSADFASLLQARLASTFPKPEHPTRGNGELLSEAEVKEWEAIFSQGRKPK